MSCWRIFVQWNWQLSNLDFSQPNRRVLFHGWRKSQNSLWNFLLSWGKYVSGKGEYFIGMTHVVTLISLRTQSRFQRLRSWRGLDVSVDFDSDYPSAEIFPSLFSDTHFTVVSWQTFHKNMFSSGCCVLCLYPPNNTCEIIWVDTWPHQYACMPWHRNWPQTHTDMCLHTQLHTYRRTLVLTTTWFFPKHKLHGSLQQLQ